MPQKDKVYIGLDIGKTKRAAGVVREGKVLEKKTEKTHYKEGFDAVFKQAVELIEDVSKGHQQNLEGAGIGIFGIVDQEKGLLIASSASGGRRNIPIMKDFQRRFGFRVNVCNDVAAAALGEHIYGAGKGARSSATIMIGTGIGVGIVLDNKLWEGAHFLAGQSGWGGILG